MSRFDEMVGLILEQLRGELELRGLELNVLTTSLRSPLSPEADARIDLIIRPKTNGEKVVNQ